MRLQLLTVSVGGSELPEVQVTSGLRSVSTKLHDVTPDRAGILIQIVIKGCYDILRTKIYCLVSKSKFLKNIMDNLKRWNDTCHGRNLAGGGANPPNIFFLPNNILFRYKNWCKRGGKGCSCIKGRFKSIFPLFLTWILRKFAFSSSATLTEVFPCFFLSCKANARVKFAKTGQGTPSSKLVVIWVVLCIGCV
jgi:hypothetical protein